MITSFNCTCGNTNVNKAKAYDGWLGYEAIICTECGVYSDTNGSHDKDEFSEQFITK